MQLLDAATLRSYIAKAKQLNPFIPEELTGVRALHFPLSSPVLISSNPQEAFSSKAK